MKKLIKTTPLASKISKLGCALAGAACCLSLSSLNAAVIADENFDYAVNKSLNEPLMTGGTGWSGGWDTSVSGRAGPSTSGTDQSLHFSQSPGLVTDGSNHIFVDAQRATERDWTTAVDLASQDFYFTALVRGFAGTGGSPDGFNSTQVRFEFFDAAGAMGNMRANVGISFGTLFAYDGVGEVNGYGAGVTYADAITADDQTYLLAMKRDGAGISASLILADGDLSTIASEPISWQVTDAGGSGVDLTSLRMLSEGDGDGGLRFDDMTIATTWADAVSNITVIPEPATYGLLAGFLVLPAVALRRRARG